MRIVRLNPVTNYARCEHCGAELEYDKFDLQWTHTEEEDYYIICPNCKQIIWLTGTPTLHRMYHEAWEERKKMQ